MSNSGSTPARGGLSLYANLLDPQSENSSATISRAPVAFTQPQAEDDASKKHQINAAALRFQPTKRPQLSSQKQKPKLNFPKAFAAPAAAAAAGRTTAENVRPEQSTQSTQSTQRPTHKSTFADWAAGDDDDVNGFYASGAKPQRGGKKRRKKNKDEYVVPQSWDDYYDPTRPTNYEEYMHSDERAAEAREWKDRLYAHRDARMGSGVSDNEDERPAMNKQFAPPAGYNFAPPSFASPPSFAPPPPPPADLPDDKTGDDAYSRRLALSQQHAPPPSIAPPPPPPDTSSATISRAPVRFEQAAAPPPPPPADLDDEPEPESEGFASRKKGFAERQMAKMGWTKGSGLGASGDGIVSALHVQVQKRKKKSDAEGGGWADPKGVGRIVGGRRAPGGVDDGGKFGAMSEVIRVENWVDSDLGPEGDGEVMQRIGEECNERFGSVERVFVYHGSKEPLVFVKFTSQLSALRAVNALDGVVFSGQTVRPRFWETEKFESGAWA